MKHARADYDRIQDPEGKIPEDEPVLLIRAQDILSEDIAREYARRARELGAHDVADAVARHVPLMAAWSKKKVPDL